MPGNLGVVLDLAPETDDVIVDAAVQGLVFEPPYLTEQVLAVDDRPGFL